MLLCWRVFPSVAENSMHRGILNQCWPEQTEEKRSFALGILIFGPYQMFSCSISCSKCCKNFQCNYLLREKLRVREISPFGSLLGITRLCWATWNTGLSAGPAGQEQSPSCATNRGTNGTLMMVGCGVADHSITKLLCRNLGCLREILYVCASQMQTTLWQETLYIIITKSSSLLVFHILHNEVISWEIKMFGVALLVIQQVSLHR